MNRKIPFHELASLLAANCNVTPEEAEDFIKNFFDLIAQTLTSGETVKIKGIGTFAPTGDTDSPIEFTPDAPVADTINAPFALFEPEELNDTVTEAELSQIDSPTYVTESTPTSEPAPVAEPTPAPDLSPTPEPEPIADPEPVVDPESVIEPAPVVESEPEVAPVSTPEPEPSTTPVASAFYSGTSFSESTDEGSNAESEGNKAESEENTPTTAEREENTPVSTAVQATPAPTFPEEEPEEYLPEQEKRSNSGFGMGFLIGLLVGLALGACAVYFAIDYIFPTNATLQDNIEDTAEQTDLLAGILADAEGAVAALDSLPADTVTATAVADTIAAAPAQTAGQPKVEEPKAVQSATPAAPAPKEVQPTSKTVKDTIKKGYLLNDMAKKHYGNKCFWVYIYEENKGRISNPNRVSPGLELVIPDASKYGIDSSNPASIAAANEKAGKILSKYPR